jgi:hypothetical protein
MPKQLLFSASGTAATVGTTKSLAGYRMATLIIQGLAAETISVTPQVGTLSGVGIPVFTSAGVAQASTALTNGAWYIRDLAVDRLQITKSGAVDSIFIALLAT